MRSTRVEIFWQITNRKRATERVGIPFCFFYFGNTANAYNPSDYHFLGCCCWSTTSSQNPWERYRWKCQQTKKAFWLLFLCCWLVGSSFFVYNSSQAAAARHFTQHSFLSLSTFSPLLLFSCVYVLHLWEGQIVRGRNPRILQFLFGFSPLFILWVCIHFLFSDSIY